MHCNPKCIESRIRGLKIDAVSAEGVPMDDNEINETRVTGNVFQYKNYTLTFFGALVSNLGNLLYSFAVSFYILKLTNNEIGRASCRERVCSWV